MEFTDLLLWVLSVLLIGVGIAGTVLPALPGTVLVLAGIVVGAWIDDFTRVGWVALASVTVLAIVSGVVDYLSGVLGAQRAGASRLAVIGAAVGTVAGIFMGFVGVLFMPLVGAAVGEWLARRDQVNAMRIGVATWVGLMIGMVAKVALAFVMVGIFVVALLV
ncbi:DUF456 domain-containing protein [Ramlibacter rhizophilus]|uniref:DUF456 domain-containing protein n=1 Tax=Ramlibacter rhizophilus TaxID=1781167 RepID=A0A4Z0BH95_9BURK|nr:DUF456 domain-containing protein [Ramlibacter rhizophilus]TFY97833.1 DUF456 domain-containing protein [Ramlibacter rhizophilus]